MVTTGIIQRRQNKAYFYLDENKPLLGEIVYALDTDEYGTLDKNGEFIWVPFEGLVTSVSGKQGDVILDKNDVGLSEVDNTSDLDKPVSTATETRIKQHEDLNNNPHNVTKEQIGLDKVDNTSDLEKPLSTIASEKISNLETNKVDNSRVLTDVPAGAVFTDTTYEVKDGELSEYNFTLQRKNKLDNLETAGYVLAPQALKVSGRNITLVKGDGTSETIQTQDNTYNDSHLIKEINDLKTNKVDNSRVLTDVPAGAVFTDTLFDDTEIRNTLVKLETSNQTLQSNIDTLDSKITNKFVTERQESDTKYLGILAEAESARKLNGKALSDDISADDSSVPASITAVRKALTEALSKISISSIANNLDGGSDKVLSAEQGKILSEKITELRNTLTSDDANLDTLQEVIDFIKRNRELIATGGVESIVGLQEALDKKVDRLEYESNIDKTSILNKIKEVDGSGSGLDADLLDGLDSSKFNQKLGINLEIDSTANARKIVQEIKLEDGVVTKLGLVDINKGIIGLENVDNTSDLNKPISTAVKTALDTKVPLVEGTTDTALRAKIAEIADNAKKIGGVSAKDLARAGRISNQEEYQNAPAGIYRVNSSLVNFGIPEITNADFTMVKASPTIAFFINYDYLIVKTDNNFNILKSPGGSDDVVPEDILTALKTVDGRGSGLDADLFQGFDIAHFALRAEINQLKMELEDCIKKIDTRYESKFVVEIPTYTETNNIGDIDHNILFLKEGLSESNQIESSRVYYPRAPYPTGIKSAEKRKYIFSNTDVKFLFNSGDSLESTFTNTSFKLLNPYTLVLTKPVYYKHKDQANYTFGEIDSMTITLRTTDVNPEPLSVEPGNEDYSTKVYRVYLEAEYNHKYKETTSDEPNWNTGTFTSELNLTNNNKWRLVLPKIELTKEYSINNQVKLDSIITGEII